MPTSTTHPYITMDDAVCGGAPAILDTRFPVRSAVVYVLHFGMTVEDVVREWPHLSPAMVHDALSYYYDHHQDAIDADIAEHRRIAEEERARQNAQ